ncbi:MAG: hypothetical protein IKH65_05990, partial [Clostridia bacterium]|nr:hypothetical protein [Clostridia bacterium]
RRFLETDEGKLTYPQVNPAFPPTFFTTAAKDFLRFEGYDMMEEYKQNNIPFDTFEGTGIIQFHAWTIVTIVKKGRECLNKTVEFIMKYLPDYKEFFEKYN